MIKNVRIFNLIIIIIRSLLLLIIIILDISSVPKYAKEMFPPHTFYLYILNVDQILLTY